MTVIKKYIDKRVEVTDDIMCNSCGRSLKHPLSGYFHGAENINVYSQLGARFGNGISHEFSLCEYCLDEMFKKFHIPPEVTNRCGKTLRYKPDFGNQYDDEYYEDNDE